MTQDLLKVVVDFDKVAEHISSIGGLLREISLSKEDKKKYEADLLEIIELVEALKTKSVENVGST